MKKTKIVAAAVCIGILAVFSFQNCSGFNSAAPAGSQVSSSSVTSTEIAINEMQLIGGAVGQDFSSMMKIVQMQVLNSLALNSTCESISTCEASSSGSTQTLTSTCDGGSGTVDLNFSAPACSILNSNQIVVMPNLLLSSSGAGVSLSSATTTNYDGSQSGGGFDLGYSISGATVQMGINGLRILEAGVLDISTQTPVPLQGTLNIGSGTVSITNGSLTLKNNISDYSLTMAAQSLLFNSSCLCPIGGSLAGSISGNYSGNVSLTFQSACGSMILAGLNTSQVMTVPSCTP